MRKHLTLMLGVLFLIGLLGIGCVPKVKKEHLDRLEKARLSAEASELELENMQAEQAEWEQKAADKERELAVKKAERDDIAQQLGK